MLGSQSPNRTALFSALLADSIARHGWSERVEIVCSGFGTGAGRVDVASLATVGVVATSDIPQTCPDVEDEIERLEVSDVLVVTTDAEAREFISWPEVDGKQVFALSDFLGEEGWAVRDAQAPLSDYAIQVREGVHLLLRALVAEPR